MVCRTSKTGIMILCGDEEVLVFRVKDVFCGMRHGVFCPLSRIVDKTARMVMK